jgi:hypothetical protein
MPIIKEENGKTYIKCGFQWCLCEKLLCAECGEIKYVRKYRVHLHKLCHRCANSKNQELRKEYKYEGSEEYKKLLDRRKQAIRIKGNICHICKQKNLPIFLYCFHHPNPQEKEFNILGKLVGYSRWRKELDKTIMLCLHCHKIEHFGSEKLDP